MQATTNFAAQKIEDKKEMEMNHKENKNKMKEEMLYRSQIMDDACSNKLLEKFEEVLQELMYLHCDDSDDENVCECGVPESEECRPDCPYQARKAAEEGCPLAHECLKKIKELQEWVSAKMDDKDGAAWNPFGRHLVNMHTCFTHDFDKKYTARIISTFIAWLLKTKHELHKQAKTASKLTRSGGKWLADHIRVCNCGCNEVYPARFYLNIPFMIDEQGDDSQWVGFTIDFNVDQSNPKEAWFTIGNKLLREIREVGEEEGKTQEAIDCLTNDLFGPKLNWLAKRPDLDITITNKGKIDTPEERKKRKEKFARKQLKEAKRREDQAEQRRVDKEIQDRRLAERVAREEEERKVREAEFAARVAVLAERERQNKQAEIAAKEERGRIAEANKKLKAEQKEAERVAKFVNKRK